MGFEFSGLTELERFVKFFMVTRSHKLVLPDKALTLEKIGKLLEDKNRSGSRCSSYTRGFITKLVNSKVIVTDGRMNDSGRTLYYVDEEMFLKLFEECKFLRELETMFSLRSHVYLPRGAV